MVKIDKRSEAAIVARRLYKAARWERLRRDQLNDTPYCEFCHGRGEFSAAEVVDHIKPHKGDVKLFYDADNLQSLCKPCHDSEKQRLEKSGRKRMRFGPDGLPLPEVDDWLGVGL